VRGLRGCAVLPPWLPACLARCAPPTPPALPCPAAPPPPTPGYRGIPPRACATRVVRRGLSAPHMRRGPVLVVRRGGGGRGRASEAGRVAGRGGAGSARQLRRGDAPAARPPRKGGSRRGAALGPPAAEVERGRNGAGRGGRFFLALAQGPLVCPGRPGPPKNTTRVLRRPALCVPQSRS
jgi:hypothetical protein